MKEAANVVQRVLVISALSGAETCAAAIMQQMGLDAEVVPGRREAVEALRTGVYAAVIVDDALAEGDPRGAEVLWKMAGLAIPMQVNFALTGKRAAGTRSARGAGAARTGTGCGAAGGAPGGRERTAEHDLRPAAAHAACAAGEPAVSATGTAAAPDGGAGWEPEAAAGCSAGLAVIRF